MKRRLVGIGLGIGAGVLVCWAIINGVDSIAYAIESGDALGGLSKMGIPILPILAFLYLVKKVAGQNKIEAIGGKG